jgi:hypothetical protein
MKVGDLVKYSRRFNLLPENFKKDITGIVVETKGTRWVKVTWIDGIIHDEHIDDLVLAK